jgi:hypothetical protein
MASYLLAWNPEKFDWRALRKNIEHVGRRGYVTERWSCGNRTDFPSGSEVFLIRLGSALKGIVGRGVTVSDSLEDEHWDPEKRRKGIKARYVRVRFTELSESPIVVWSELQQPPLSRFKWSVMASGVILPEVIADELHRRWEMHRGPAVSTPKLGKSDALSSSLGSDFAEELSILEQADLSITEKEQLILARRGQGVFRENLLRVEPLCRVTGIADAMHLRASHMKPWSVCTNAERLSENNGLMLAPHIDHLFDRGYLTFTDVGDLLISPLCSEGVLAAWGVPRRLNSGPFRSAQRPFLTYHREHCYKS